MARTCRVFLVLTIPFHKSERARVAFTNAIMEDAEAPFVPCRKCIAGSAKPTGHKGRHDEGARSGKQNKKKPRKAQASGADARAAGGPPSKRGRSQRGAAGAAGSPAGSSSDGSVRSTGASLASVISSSTLHAATAVPAAPGAAPAALGTVGCQVCHSLDHEDKVLLCDGCNLEYHTFCLDPPLTTVPEGDWFCPRCATTDLASPGSSGSPRGAGRHCRECGAGGHDRRTCPQLVGGDRGDAKGGKGGSSRSSKGGKGGNGSGRKR